MNSPLASEGRLHSSIRPQEGFGKSGRERQIDLIVTVEVVVEEFDPDWWANYRRKLEGISINRRSSSVRSR